MVSEHSVACRIETLGLETIGIKLCLKVCENISFNKLLLFYSFYFSLVILNLF